MKKFDTLISNYLYTNKTVDLEGIGSFRLDEGFVLPPDADKSAFFPLEGIHFEHNTRAETTPGLIDFIIQHSGKIRSLVQADFASYVTEVKQFVNIGKPWAIEGIGTLHKNKEGRFELVPGEALSERVNINYAESEEDEEEPVKRRRWMVGFILAVAIIAVVAGLGFGIYVLFVKTQDNTASTDPVETIFPDQDSAALASDTLTASVDSVSRPAATDSTSFKVIHEITRSRSRAVTRTAQLNEFGVKSQYDSVRVGDSLRYRLFIFQSIRPSDTTRAKDSLSLYFGRRVRLEKL